MNFRPSPLTAALLLAITAPAMAAPTGDAPADAAMQAKELDTVEVHGERVVAVAADVEGGAGLFRIGAEVSELGVRRASRERSQFDSSADEGAGLHGLHGQNAPVGEGGRFAFDVAHLSADHAAGAAHVFKLEVANQAADLGCALDGAGCAVPTATGGSGHEHVERVEQGFALRPSGQGHGSTSSSAEGQEVAFGNGHAGRLIKKEKILCRAYTDCRQRHFAALLTFNQTIGFSEYPQTTHVPLGACAFEGDGYQPSRV